MNLYFSILILVLLTIILVLLIGLIYWIVVNTRRWNHALAQNIRLGLSRKYEIDRARECDYGHKVPSSSG